MTKLTLLPGEREEAYLRPSPFSYLGAYTRALSFALVGILARMAFLSEAWTSVEAGPWYMFWTYLYGNAAAAFVYLNVGLVGGGMLVTRILQRGWWRGGLIGLAAGAAVTATHLLYSDQAYVQSVPILLALVSLVAIVVLEVDRNVRAIRFTNVRLVAHGGLWDREEVSFRYEDIADIDVRQGLLGRVFDYGTLIPVGAPHVDDEPNIQIRGVRPLAQGRELLSAMVQHATASDEMKTAGDTESRLYRALSHFRRPSSR